MTLKSLSSWGFPTLGICTDWSSFTLFLHPSFPLSLLSSSLPHSLSIHWDTKMKNSQSPASVSSKSDRKADSLKDEKGGRFCVRAYAVAMKTIKQRYRELGNGGRRSHSVPLSGREAHSFPAFVPTQAHSQQSCLQKVRAVGFLLRPAHRPACSCAGLPFPGSAGQGRAACLHCQMRTSGWRSRVSSIQPQAPSEP